MEDGKKKSLMAIIALATLGLIEFTREKLRDKGQKALQKKVDETQPKPITKYNDEITIKTVMIESIDSLDLEKNYKEVVMDEAEINNWKSLICNTSSEIIRTSIINGSFSGLLKCDIPLSELAKSKTDSSLMRGFVTSNGKISQQANFQEVGFSQLAPSMIFNCLSILTSQYYLKGIWNELDKINKQNRKIENHIINGSWASLGSNYDILKEINNKTTYYDTDFMLAHSAAKEISKELKKYQENLNGNFSLNVESNLTDFKEAESKIMELERSNFFIYFNIVMGAEMLNYIATIILLKIAHFLNKTEDASNFSDRVKLSSWNFYLSKFCEVKHDVLTYLEYESESSLFYKNKINKLKDECETMFQQTERLINDTYSVISQPMTNYLYIDTNGNMKKYVKDVDVWE
ncbi:hypothetical protein [Bacteroides caecigallinarum]|uniref:hypothetical protein n=1 Tax=Bacteroides caecigallinarum TaxID=1411144 RepID=UPI001959BD71|nr:hypothetical protein [Bacteroides caecigallinarum]MBM6884092.1 hypothetical protein [Bacteroides caecigallinarum]